MVDDIHLNATIRMFSKGGCSSRYLVACTVNDIEHFDYPVTPTSLDVSVLLPYTDYSIFVDAPAHSGVTS